MRTAAAVLIVTLISLSDVGAQQRRPASPEGTASTQVNGRWIDIVYGQPILRGRTNIFGSGADYGNTLFDGGTVWRAGANVSTRLRNEMPLEIGGKRIPPGELVMLIDLKSEKDWTLILTAQSYAKTYDPANTKDLYGGYNYRPDQDVTRADDRRAAAVQRRPADVAVLGRDAGGRDDAGGVGADDGIGAVQDRPVSSPQPCGALIRAGSTLPRLQRCGWSWCLSSAISHSTSPCGDGWQNLRR